jgi:hypothetical protein
MASLSTSALAVGAHNLTAVYLGSATHAGSSSAGVGLTVAPAATTTTLVAGPSSMFGELVTMTATVTAMAPGAVGGLVSFRDNGIEIGTGAVNAAGQASLATTALTVGAHSFTAVYLGSTNYLTSSSGMAYHTVSAPPISLTLNAAYGANHAVTLSGHVNDLLPAGLTVTFSGAITGSTVTDSNGDFSVTLTAALLGTVTATVTGSQPGSTGYASLVLSNVAPTIVNFTATQDSATCWTLSGQVTDEYAAGLVITFSSAIAPLNGQTVVVGDDGWFTLSFNTQGMDYSGTVTVQVLADWWGLASNLEDAYVA